MERKASDPSVWMHVSREEREETPKENEEEIQLSKT